VDVQQQVSRLGQARNWYIRIVDSVPPDGWTKPTLCAGWNALNVVAHVATGDQLFRGLIMDATGKDRAGEDLPVDFADRNRRFEDASTWEPARLKDAARKESERTVAAIAEAGEQSPQAIVPLPFGQSSMPVVRGLRLNEYIIHGHDLIPTIGRAFPTPDWFIDRGLGDGINLMQRLHLRSPHKGQAASFHIHRTDGEGEWTLRAENGQAVVEPGHNKADVSLRGPAEGLYWVLMGRGRPDHHGVEVHGQAKSSACPVP